jgi:protocatechuate 3,4-dioxygenase beta subunit
VSARSPIDRRTALGLLGGVGAAAFLSACGDSSSTSSGTSSTSSPSGAPSSGGSSASPSSGAPSCVLSPEATEGPYYLDLDQVRSDITDGSDGTPLVLAVSVVDATTCGAIENAAVDIWHCDASGVYSGVEGNRGTFLRGTQVTGANGDVEFATIYPGWYSGRAVHIHVKVHVGSNDVYTGQLYFPADVTSDVHRDGPYAQRGDADTPNESDSIFQESDGSMTTLALTANGDGYRAATTLGVPRA